MKGAGAALAGPSLACIACAVALVVLATATGYYPFGAPADLTLSEAAALRDNLEMTRQLRHGADPNRRASVRRDIVRSTPLEMTPLESAVAIRRAEVMELLVRNGARIDATNYPVLRCFAERENAGDVLAYLQQAVPAAPPVDCDGITLPW
jgi:hypothetical protein